MSTPFDPDQGLIVVTGTVFGPLGLRTLRMALDTGATTTVVRTAALLVLGYDPALSVDRIGMTTASGVEYVPRRALPP